MAAIPRSGFLLIADLTGYTAYLSQSELEHAPAIAGDLLATVVASLEPPFRLAKFEGDAAFLVTEDGGEEPPNLLQAVEACYLDFRRRLRSIDQATSCGCNSCVLAPRLDLKLLLHHGSYVQTQIAGRDELAGRDVILVHRLLKSEAAVNANGTGFALFTSAAIEALRVKPTTIGLVEAEETFANLGPVRTFKFDVEARWHAESGIQRMDSARHATIFDILTLIDAEPSVVWAHLTSSSLRASWERPTTLPHEAANGRSLSDCVTDRLATLEEIVDWQPPRHIGWRFTAPMLGQISATADLAAVKGRTRLRLRWAGQGGDAVDPMESARIRRERVEALGRLSQIVAANPSLQR
jgi:hypothetical protein